MAKTTSHNHSKCIRDSLAQAERLCAEKNLRLTPIRKQVLELVWASHKAIKAYDLLKKIDTSKGDAKPPTLYRALDFLMENGLIHKVESLNAYVGCSQPSTTHAADLLICTQCGNIAECVAPHFEAGMKEAAKQSGYVIYHRNVEMRGLCPGCQ